jgi:hypothetical protein
MTNERSVVARGARLAIAFTILSVLPAMAANPIDVCKSGRPYVWPNGGLNVPFNLDQGPLGSFTNAQAMAMAEEAFAMWAAVPSATISYVNAGPLPVDVNASNFARYMFGPPDGLSPMIFDEHGEIADLMFGENNGVTAFADPTSWVNDETCEIVEGLVYLNGAMPLQFFSPKGVMLHEFGHFSGLGHSATNSQVVGPAQDTSGPSPFNTFGIAPPQELEVMGGASFSQPALHGDDIAMISALYPEPGYFASTGMITGRVLSLDGVPLSGANVIARNVANPFHDAISAISSIYSKDLTSADPYTGVYVLHGLTPGAEYAIYVDQIEFSDLRIPPLALPGPEEFWNGASESNGVSSMDDPSEFIPLTVQAGSTTTGIDIIFNAPRAGEPLNVGDEGAFQIPLPFPFTICGKTFNSLFAHANGVLSFGDPGVVFFADGAGAKMLTGPIRIAGLWTDLNANAGGLVTFEETHRQFTVRWEDVPEFPNLGSNTFSITLERRSNNVVIDYGSLTSTSGIAGASCGGAFTSGLENEADLIDHRRHSVINMEGKAAAYEAFTGNADVAETQVRFINLDRGFVDRFEPNNRLKRAALIQLPFESQSADHFTDLAPADVDFYRFHAKSGDIVVAEIVRGQFDTVLGLFDVDTGELLMSDDDGGGPGGLSRFFFQVDANRRLAVAVAAAPDAGFEGFGTGTGRYVLTVNAYHGVVLPFESDDDTIEVPLGFRFPFQGQRWTSVFANSNGNLTFGSGDLDFTPGVAEFLAGPPRIAPLWRDLAPIQLFPGHGGGLAIAEAGPRRMTIHYVSMPAFFTTSAASYSTFPNYVSVTLFRSGVIRMAWGATTRGGALVGITQGNGAVDPGPTRLLREAPIGVSGTTYELFGAEHLTDLSLQTLWWFP